MTPETILLRQVHPNFFQEGQLSSQAFFPFPKDDSRLSVYDGDQISAGDAHKHYVDELRNSSCGVWGLENSEVSGVGLQSISDSLVDFPSHTIIDFANETEKVCRKIAKKLRNLAVARGCLHAAP